MSERRLFESIKYTFSGDELRALGESLAREAQTVFNLESEKRTVTAEFGARIKAANQRVADLAERVNAGYELREVECLQLLEDPRPGLKRIVRIDTNETVRIEPMTMAEMQGTFGFQEPSGGDA